jgi:DNA mismatch repair protein MLH3
MVPTACPILPLSVEAQLQLKASVALNSLNDSIIGLVKNSVDAQAQRIHIEFDYSRGNCCVEDDGVGIPAVEFEAGGGLGLMHCERTEGLKTSDEIAD